MDEQKHGEQIPIDFPPSLRGGVYCNTMTVTHTKEEFIMDFMMVAPPVGAITARVIMSPGHVKRTILALQDNFKKYEEKFGKVQEAVEPPRKLGFFQTS